MGTTPIKRKLAAILAADVAGYSRMMGEDEEGTVRILAAHRAVIDGVIQFHDGRIIGTAGDSVLAEFSSSVEAVRCAIEIQEALKTRNESLPESRRMAFRIGVNLGDVMIQGEDLLGDGVNVAARLESIAEPGGICISASVYEQIAGKLNVGFLDIGEQNLKNIARPIRAFRVATSPGAAPAKAHGRRSRALIVAGLAVAVVAAGAGAVWYAGVLPRFGAPGPTGEPVAALSPAAVADQEAMFWESVRTSSEPSELEAYLRQYPSGAFAAIARARLEGIAAAEAKRADEAQRAAEARTRVEAEAAAARSKADAEAAAAKAKAEEEAAAAKAKAEADLAAAKAKADAETAAAKAKAEAEAATARAKAEADATAARRQAEADRAAVARLRQDAEAAVAGLKAEAEAAAAKAKADAEALAAARQAEADRAARAKAESEAAARQQAAMARFDGRWMAERACEPFEQSPSFTSRVVATIRGGDVAIETGQPGRPGYLLIRGKIADDDGLVLSGIGIAGDPRSLGQEMPQRFSGRFEGEAYEGKGSSGRRPCTITLTRAEQPAPGLQAAPTQRLPPPPVAGLARFDGGWIAQLSCERSQEQSSSVTSRVVATIRTGEVAIENGQPGNPGYFLIRGKIAEGGDLDLSGISSVGSPGGLGQRARPPQSEIPIRFSGRFEGSVYEGKGSWGRRPCTMTMTRASP